MITAIVTVKCEVGKVHAVSEALTALDGVAEVYSVSGEFDVLAIIKVKEYDLLAALVTQEIAGIEGIVRTSTHMAFRAYSKHNMEKVWAETMGE
ncbi:MAG: Lrp/AsnC ligand binding domain-containing protein [bacterium]|nr:MAG: Lrp/AsnC ligand binding domain-containing protein [bacterium]